MRSLTELHGGEFAIASEVGVGTRVSIALPRVAPMGHDVNEPLPGIFSNDVAAEIVEASRQALVAVAKEAASDAEDTGPDFHDAA